MSGSAEAPHCYTHPRQRQESFRIAVPTGSGWADIRQQTRRRRACLTVYQKATILGDRLRSSSFASDTEVVP